MPIAVDLESRRTKVCLLQRKSLLFPATSHRAKRMYGFSTFYRWSLLVDTSCKTLAEWYDRKS